MPPNALPPTRELARRVRQTRNLTGTQKKYWIAVLPHLRPDDRDRLDAILRGDVTPGDGASPHGELNAGAGDPGDGGTAGSRSGQ